MSDLFSSLYDTTPSAQISHSPAASNIDSSRPKQKKKKSRRSVPDIPQPTRSQRSFRDEDPYLDDQGNSLEQKIGDLTIRRSSNSLYFGTRGKPAKGSEWDGAFRFGDEAHFAEDDAAQLARSPLDVLSNSMGRMSATKRRESAPQNPLHGPLENLSQASARRASIGKEQSSLDRLSEAGRQRSGSRGNAKFPRPPNPLDNLSEAGRQRSASRGNAEFPRPPNPLDKLSEAGRQRSGNRGNAKFPRPPNKLSKNNPGKSSSVTSAIGKAVRNSILSSIPTNSLYWGVSESKRNGLSTQFDMMDNVHHAQHIPPPPPKKNQAKPVSKEKAEPAPEQNSTKNPRKKKKKKDKKAKKDKKKKKHQSNESLGENSKTAAPVDALGLFQMTQPQKAQEEDSDDESFYFAR